MLRKISKSILALFAITLIYACSEDEVPLPDNLVNFSNTEVGFADNVQELEIPVTLSRAAEVATIVAIDLAPIGLTYGTEFTTSPAATNNSLSVSIPAGSTSGTFKIVKSADVFLKGTESVKFTIRSITAPALLGTTISEDVKFVSIVSSGSTMQLNGIIANEAGSGAGNSVFVDFTNNQATAVARASWSLGFYSGTDFRVIINNTTSATIKALDKTDLNTVTAADTIPASGWSIGFDEASFALIDDVNGDITKTAIAEISATDTDNKVYILNLGTGGGIAARPWYKIRVLRKGAGYTLQYAKITDTTFKTIDVTKDSNYNFNYVALGTTASAASVEPAKADWDIVWSYMMYQTPYQTGFIPYAFSDLIKINASSGVTAAQVMTATTTYEAYAEANIASTTFSSNSFTIGSSWRVTSSQTEPVGVRTDRFYVVKDATGNVYKLKFLSFHLNDGGERGKPVFEYKLVKKAS